MVREQVRYDIPNEWILRRKAGLCPVCGKDKTEFDKGRRVYCSQECSDIFASRITTWQELRTDLLKERGEICELCCVDKAKNREDSRKNFKLLIDAWVEDNKVFVDKQREDELRKLDDWFNDKYSRIMDNDFAKNSIDYDVRREMEKKSGLHNYVTFEVDHIKAVALGGDMWSKDNLRVLCVDCHKVKTKEDMGKIKYFNRKKKAKIKRDLSDFGSVEE